MVTPQDDEGLEDLFPDKFQKVYRQELDALDIAPTTPQKPVSPNERTQLLKAMGLAIQQADLQRVRTLLASGIRGNDLNVRGNPFLHVAINSGNASLVMAFLDADAEVNHANAAGKTPLMAAIEGRRMAPKEPFEQIACMLIEKGANVHALDSSGATPLHKAAWLGRTKVVAALLRHGADANAINDLGRTPLHNVLYGLRSKTAGSVHIRECFELLAKHNPLLDHPDQDGHTITDLIDKIRYRRTQRELRALLIPPDVLEKFQDIRHGATEAAARANPDEVDQYGSNALHLAAREGKADMIHALIDRGFDPDTRNQEYYTPLHYAVWGRKKDAVRALLDRGASADIPDKTGNYPLHVALTTDAKHDTMADDPENRNAIITMLIQATKNLDRVGYRDRTALSIAARHNNETAVNELLQRGADVNLWEAGRNFPPTQSAGPKVKNLIFAHKRALREKG